MNVKEISGNVDRWIAEEQLPVRAGYKAVSRFDGLYPEDQEEAEAYWDFIDWAMNREHEVLLSLPKPKVEQYCLPEPDDANSFAFGSMNFQELKGQFNSHHWRIEQIYERVKDLAQSHSAISHKEGKDNTFEKFKLLVEKEFRDRAVMLMVHFNKYPQWVNRVKLMKEVGDLNMKIKKCKDIWMEHGYET